MAYCHLDFTQNFSLDTFSLWMTGFFSLCFWTSEVRFQFPFWNVAGGERGMKRGEGRWAFQREDFFGNSQAVHKVWGGALLVIISLENLRKRPQDTAIWVFHFYGTQRSPQQFLAVSVATPSVVGRWKQYWYPTGVSNLKIRFFWLRCYLSGPPKANLSERSVFSMLSLQWRAEDLVFIAPSQWAGEHTQWAGVQACAPSLEPYFWNWKAIAF